MACTTTRVLCLLQIRLLLGCLAFASAPHSEGSAAEPSVAVKRSAAGDEQRAPRAALSVREGRRARVKPAPAHPTPWTQDAKHARRRSPDDDDNLLPQRHEPKTLVFPKIVQNRDADAFCAHMRVSYLQLERPPRA
jgi:hypothetical protein